LGSEADRLALIDTTSAGVDRTTYVIAVKPDFAACVRKLDGAREDFLALGQEL